MTKRSLKNISSAVATFVVGMLLLASCNDFLYVEPTDTISVNSYEDVRRLLAGNLYNYSNDRDYMQGAPNTFLASNEMLVDMYYSDDLDVNTYMDNNFAANYRGEFTSSIDWKNPTMHETLWSLYFRSIGFYNIVLDELAKHPGATQAETEQVAGEARVLRAMCFFRLMQYFSPYNNNALGLPINTDPNRVSDYDQSRRTQADNYAFIISELEIALAYTTTPSPTYNIFYNKTFINGLLAQVYLYKGGSGAKADDDYSKAATYAQAVLDAGISSDEYMTGPASTDEWGVIRNKQYAPLVFLYAETQRFPALVGDPFMGQFVLASESLCSMYSDADKRKTEYFSSDRRFLKYGVPFRASFAQFKLCTGAEMRLIVAEANARQGNTTAAKAALNTFATPRYTAWTEPSDNDLLQTILDERRKEFCFEPYMRWLDLTRLQTGFTRSALDVNDNTKTVTIADNDYRFCMPLPKKGELKENNIEQNPGWGNF